MLDTRPEFRWDAVREASEGNVERGTFTPRTECTEFGVV